MKELKDIVISFDKAQKQKQQTALATVVHVEGSAYRKPGARMLIKEDGELTGAISGGCLEGDALRKARLAMLHKKNKLVTYDTTDEDDAQLGMRLGCNGIIRILIEPIDEKDQDNPIQLLRRFLHQRQSAVLITLFSLEHSRDNQPGTTLLLTENGKISPASTDATQHASLIADAHAVLHRGGSGIKNYPDGLTGFLEFLAPAVSILIFGAGNDAIPLAKIADIMGWETTVIDARASYLIRSRFPSAKQLIVAKPDQAFDKLTIDQYTVAILMTHNYHYDLDLLRRLLPLRLHYIGSLGPKKKLERMIDELQMGGIPADQQAVQNIHGPAGLDIGSSTPEEIALSIVSEINKVLSGKSGDPLREKPAVHPENLFQLL